MTNFNKVFSAVKKACGENEKIEGIEAIQKIADGLGLPMDRLHFYLECIEQIGLICYDSNDKKITLTGKGQKTAHVFPA